MGVTVRKVRVDARGILFHTIPSLALSIEPAALTAAAVLFALYQYVDYSHGEDPEEVRGDIVEFLAGVIIGVVARAIAAAIRVLNAY
ncbi:MAG: hypothetical protein QXU30_07940 [Sulfolobales archaeon]